ncbi:MAG: cobalt transport protein CbiN [Archaeoglobaceae archaeon]|nr:cobalt transport protein CbiN [Archaeoglobaceae archaeon]
MISLLSWLGVDEIAEEMVREIKPDFEPWFNPIFHPGELETFFFSLQVAIGAMILGYILGYLHGRS